MKSLSLVLNGEEKVFTIPFVNGLSYRKYVELQSRIKDLKNLTVEEMDELIDIIVLTFENNFTRDEYYTGTPFDELVIKAQLVFISSKDLEKDNEDEGNEKK